MDISSIREFEVLKLGKEHAACQKGTMLSLGFNVWSRWGRRAGQSNLD